MGSGDLLAKQVDGDVAPQVALQPGQGQVLRGADEPDRLPLPAPLLHLPRLHRPRGLQQHRQGGQDHPADQGHQRLGLYIGCRRGEFMKKLRSGENTTSKVQKEY